MWRLAAILERQQAESMITKNLTNRSKRNLSFRLEDTGKAVVYRPSK